MSLESIFVASISIRINLGLHKGWNGKLILLKKACLFGIKKTYVWSVIAKSTREQNQLIDWQYLSTKQT